MNSMYIYTEILGQRNIKSDQIWFGTFFNLDFVLIMYIKIY